MAQFIAVYDACVLYPAPLRNLLMYLALTDLFSARWTNAIHDEWTRSAIRDYPGFTRANAERVRDLMNAHVRDCLVSGYEDLIPALTLPDPDDRHVLAAAIRAGGDIIVTSNLADFPSTVLAPFGIEAQHPDQFVADLLAIAPAAVCEAAKRQRASLKKPPMNVEEYLESLIRQGLVQTVDALKPFGAMI